MSYEPFDPRFADDYDRCPRWIRFVVTVVIYAREARTLRGVLCEFHFIESFFGEHSLRRKLNKLHYKGIL